jgi:TolB protein
VAQNLSEAIKEDLMFTSLFDFVEKGSFANLDTKAKLYEMQYEDWGLTGATFALKLGYQVSGPKVVLEALLYDIPGNGKNKIFGTRYEYDSDQYWKVVHSLTEDILKALTGESGLFNSRILMVCRGPKYKGKSTKEIFISDADGRNLKAVTSDRRLSLSPSWSPDGKTITYTQYQMRPVRQPKALAS